MIYSRSKLIATRNRAKHELNVARSKARKREHELKRLLRSLKRR